MKVWKRNAVIAAVILFVGTAVYLNWSYGQGQQALNRATAKTTAEPALEQGSTPSEGKILGQPVLVDGAVKNEAMPVSTSTKPADTGETAQESTPSQETAAEATTGQSVGSGKDYFAAARLTRQQARDTAMTLLKDAPEAEKAAESMQALVNSTMAESRIENLVTAKGYTDCVAFIGESSISVVVATETGVLESADVARITDIVKGETAFSQNQIKIVPAGA